MARIRSLKPETRTDETVASWPREVRLAWIYLWGYLDDYGRGRDNLALIRAELFPLDPDVTEKKLDAWLRLMASTPGDSGEPPLCRYEVDGRRFLHAVRWRHQKISHPTPSRIPPCLLGHPSGTSPENISNGSGPRAQARAGADQGSGIKGSGQRTGGTDLTRIQKILGCPTEWASQVFDDILSKAPATVLNPIAYVMAAIEKDPERYRPTPTAPRFSLCQHGAPPAACPDCVEAGVR